MKKLVLFMSILLATSFTTKADDMSTFFDQLNALITQAGADHFSSAKGILTGTNENGVKTYNSKFPLTYFKVIISEQGEGRFITATSMNAKVVESLIGGLLNKGFRSLNGISLEKESDYKAANPASCAQYSSVTELSKTGSPVKILVMKSNVDAVWTILIL
jgi:hypothetical protein